MGVMDKSIKWLVILIVFIILMAVMAVISLVWGMFGFVGVIFLFGAFAMIILKRGKGKIVVPLIAIGILMLLASAVGLEIWQVDLSTIPGIESLRSVI